MCHERLESTLGEQVGRWTAWWGGWWGAGSQGIPIFICTAAATAMTVATTLVWRWQLWAQCGSSWGYHGSGCVKMGRSQPPSPHCLPRQLCALSTCLPGSPSGCQVDNCDELSPQRVGCVEFSCGKLCVAFQIYFISTTISHFSCPKPVDKTNFHSN